MPFLTSEIFNCEINQLLDKFFEEGVQVTKEKEISECEDDESTEITKTTTITHTTDVEVDQVVEMGEIG
jgi:uncharacterized protein (UPF0179 family)